jgi:hypothetical protein
LPPPGRARSVDRRTPWRSDREFDGLRKRRIRREAISGDDPHHADGRERFGHEAVVRAVPLAKAAAVQEHEGGAAGVDTRSAG